jgi:hypothetical protein
MLEVPLGILAFNDIYTIDDSGVINVINYYNSIYVINAINTNNDIGAMIFINQQLCL